MTTREFKNLRLGDIVMDVKGNPVKVVDIQRNLNMLRYDGVGGSLRDYHYVELPMMQGAPQKGGKRK